MTERDKLFVYCTEQILPDGDILDVFANGHADESKGTLSDLGGTCQYLDMHDTSLPAHEIVERICLSFQVAHIEGEFRATRLIRENNRDVARRLAQCCSILTWIAVEGS